ncbi:MULTISPECIES: DUF4190 domain-containing protein [unclassified Actinomyces]|uniref:DUF4190 domain-containing protein n=1 Tax=unclassified Actinomyces TaxID=2609248 RepID=UPI00137441C2|nr:MULTISPECIES: DUF4190 domain-containing protein [unclassified Actinomyces]MBW3068594.1 DUF4190 domain-containing protein [Actinomyces sp. 594]NDR54049.1 DUF4190 domain-containing protein [Actinomyces sp. 565]QHO90837.1 hypothetical protein CWT12_05150 [Actinomyces sp. 432]
MTSYDPNQNPGNNQGYPAGQAPQNQAPSYNQPAGYGMNPMMPSTEKNNLGGWALGLGIASVLCCGIFTGIPAAILGYLGIQAANEGRASNKGMSIAGIILGALSIVSMIIAFATGTYSELLNR